MAHVFFSINDKNKSSPSVVVSGKSGAKQYSTDFFHFHGVPSLKLTAKAPENRPGPKGKFHLPTIHFLMRTVSFREGN